MCTSEPDGKIDYMSSRGEKIQAMNNELQKLEQQLHTFARLTEESTQQFAMIKKVGIQQASFFMSSHSVFQNLNESKEAPRADAD